MNISKKIDYCAAGFAIFAMFFGAGNIIFPLTLGHLALNKTPIAILGFTVTAIVMPFLGFLAMVAFQGQIIKFFSNLGKVPGFLLATTVIALLGPFGSAPRCLTLAYSTLSMSFPGIPLIIFSGISCLLIYLFIFKKNSLLMVLGYFLSPLKIGLLLLILTKGFLDSPINPPQTCAIPNSDLLLHSLKEGYNTMDLLAAFFFAPLVLTSLISKTNNDEKSLKKFIYISSFIGACTLFLVYVGFSWISYSHSADLLGIPPEKLLAALSIKILGPNAGIIVSLTVNAGIIVSLTVAVDCLTTAVALIAAFAGFVHKEIFQEKVNYKLVVLGSLTLTFFVTTLEFQGIASFLSPILEVGYPILIGLTFYNLYVYFKGEKEKASLPEKSFN